MTVREFLNSLLDANLNRLCLSLAAVVGVYRGIEFFVGDGWISVPFQVVGYLIVTGVIVHFEDKANKDV